MDLDSFGFPASSFGFFNMKKQKNIKIAIVVSRFNEFITKRLLEGCLAEFKRRSINVKQVPVHWVPGAFEIPLLALKLAQKKNIDAVICLGAVIKGETIHFDLIAENTARGILQASLTAGKPVIFGVITTNTVSQAYKRSQPKGENKGYDAAVAALDMMTLLKSI